MKKSTLIIIGVIVIVAIWVFTSYNKLVGLNQQADAQWANVEAQYQRRLDLISNLVNSVKGSLTQEQKVFGDIADARTRYAGASTPNDKASAASDVESSFGRLLVIVENYPQLTSTQAVRDLMAQLEGTENRVSVERTRFNNVVLLYNTTVRRFPTNVLARVSGFVGRAYFKATTGAEVAPTVNLQ